MIKNYKNKAVLADGYSIKECDDLRYVDRDGKIRYKDKHGNDVSYRYLDGNTNDGAYFDSNGDI